MALKNGSCPDLLEKMFFRNITNGKREGRIVNRTLTAVPGLLVGHATDRETHTGCTAILCPSGFTPGIHVPGFAPASRETELMYPEALVESVHGLCLAGGSAFGLAAATGVVRFLRERNVGFETPFARVPIVPGAAIFDLDLNTAPGLLPDESMGYAAARAASGLPVEQGAVGAGTGARCGRVAGFERPAKSGLGSWGMQVGEVVVSALVVLNALGNVYDPDTGDWLAGGHDAAGKRLEGASLYSLLAGQEVDSRLNTVLVVVATNVPLSKVGASRLARMSGTGLSRVLRPAHMLFDGDIVFALASREGPCAGENLLGVMGAEAVSRAAVSAIHAVNG